MPKVSIIVPVYNVERYVCECLNSILLQSYTDWECLLVDDGSVDKSGQICDEYALSDSRFKVFHVNNGGVSKARNIGLEKMTGEWVMFVDSDDAIAEKTLEICIKLAEINGLDLLQFALTRNKDFLSVCCPDKSTVLDLDAFINTKKVLVCAGGSLFKCSIIQNNNLFFDYKLKLAEDQLFLFNYVNNAKRFQIINNSFYWYRENPNSATHGQKSGDMMRSIKTLYDFKRENRLWSAYIDRINVLFLIKIIQNNDIKFSVMRKLIKDVEITDKQMIEGDLPKFFYSVNRISSTIAIVLVKYRKYLFGNKR